MKSEEEERDGTWKINKNRGPFLAELGHSAEDDERVRDKDGGVFPQLLRIFSKESLYSSSRKIKREERKTKDFILVDY